MDGVVIITIPNNMHMEYFTVEYSTACIYSIYLIGIPIRENIPIVKILLVLPG